jgi:hypothetical protein
MEIPFKVDKRVASWSLVSVGNFSLLTGGTLISISKSPVAPANSASLVLGLTGGTAGTCYQVRNSNDTTAYLAASAEL